MLTVLRISLGLILLFTAPLQYNASVLVERLARTQATEAAAPASTVKPQPLRRPLGLALSGFMLLTAMLLLFARRFARAIGALTLFTAALWLVSVMLSFTAGSPLTGPYGFLSLLPLPFIAALGYLGFLLVRGTEADRLTT